VKWGKSKFSDLEMDTTQPGIVFKMQLYSLTSVAPERQKLMVKGKVLGVRVKIFFFFFVGEIKLFIP
jgi:hypothetical protein